jgi:Tol biopolymer transport system component
MRRRLVLLVVALLVPASSAEAEYETVLVSRLGTEGPAANRESSGVVDTSRNGRYVVFATNARNFPGTDVGPGAPRVFRKDTATGRVMLVSRESGRSGLPLSGTYPATSRDGRFVCYLLPRGTEHIAVRDTEAGTTRYVPGTAVHPYSRSGEDLYASACGITDDGRRVAYTTELSHVPEDRDHLADVYLYDLDVGAWTLVSRASGLDGADADEVAVGPRVTPDGRYVVFESLADNLADGEDESRWNVFRRDVEAGRTDLVSRVMGTDPTPGLVSPGPGGMPQQYGSDTPSISDAGRFVAFGSWVWFLAGQGTAEPLTRQVYVRDLESNTTIIASRANGADGEAAQGVVTALSISGNGRYVAFDARADNLDYGERLGGATQVYVRDLRDARTNIVSRATGPFGTPASGPFGAFAPVASDTGRVAFTAASENLVPDDVEPDDRTYYHTFLRASIEGCRKLLPADLPGPPEVSGLRVVESSRRARAAQTLPRAQCSYRRGRFLMTYQLSEYARTLIEVDRRDGPDWTRIRYARYAGREGENVVPLDRIGTGKALRPGAYRVRLEMTDFAGTTTEHVRGFRIRR